MKAILVKAAEQTITEIQVSHNHQDISKAIGAQLFTCPASDKKGNTIYADDEALINGRPMDFVSVPSMYPDPLVGDILFLGSDHEGESKDCTLTVEDVKKLVSFPSLAQVRGF
jgi:hypothetical protein